jgi:acyl-CoA synthetase (AMP-forming)/AMP-acid ligase II
MPEAEQTGKPDTPDFFANHVANHPDRPYVISPDRALTYGELAERASTLAKSLYGLGLRPGDRAALMTYNFPEYSEVSFALNLLGVGLVMIGYRLKPPEIEYIVENSDARLLVFYHEFADRIMPYRTHYKKVLPGGLITFGNPSADGPQNLEALFADPPDVDLGNLPAPENPATGMIYTSGTTGRPKGAARGGDATERAGTMEYLSGLLGLIKFTAEEVHLVCCPLYHSAPLFFNMITTMLGGTRVMQSRFDPEQFLELVARHRVTSTHLVPTMVIRLLQVPESFTDKLDLTSLRTVICGAAPLFPEHKLAFLDRFGPILYEYYGSTETGINAFITSEEMRTRPASVGKALPYNDLMIVDKNGNEVPDGERGVLYIHCPILMDGYHKNEAATAETYLGKHMTVGDVAVRDEEGYIYIVDRVKDMIIRGGVNIYPAEIEEVISAMGDVIDVAVVGKPDTEFGESVVAFIVPAKGVVLSEKSIQTYCDQNLANYKIPATIIFTDEIPRTPTGKILKRNLREML